MDRGTLCRMVMWTLTAWLVATLPAAAAPGDVTYEIAVTNLTKGQTFTPILAAVHGPDVKLFEVGSPASAALETLAEAGDTGPLTDALLALGSRGVGGVQTAPELLGPGETRTFRVEADRRFRWLSLAAMLIPTNDTFFALNGVPLPKRRGVQFVAAAYDAGTEENDQNCARIPGPTCGGEGSSGPAPGDEGFVGISNGIHDLGIEDASGNQILDPLVHDWRNPVAHVTVQRVR